MTTTLTRCIGILLLLSSQQIFSQTKNDSLITLPDDKKVYVDTKVYVDKDLVFSKVEVEASFPGGIPAWNRFIADAMKRANYRKFKDEDQGTCRVRFIVNKNGSVTNVEALTMKNTRLAKLAVSIIESSPRWSPAMQNGKPVNAYREQPVTLKLEK